MPVLPVVSVIIPTYRRISQTVVAIKSVLNQKTTLLYELIVVNDDVSSSELREALSGLTLTLLSLGENQGVAAARNYGVSHSCGQYIAFLDSDDVWKEDKLERQLTAMKEQGATISHTDELWVRNGKEIKKSALFKKKSGDIFVQSLKQVNISPSTVMMSRSLWNRYHGFDESFPLCEDYELWLRMTAQEEVLLIPEELIIKHAGHDDQLSNVAGLDYYRIKALVKLLKESELTETERFEAEKELQRKAGIFISGAEKRGNLEKANEIKKMIKFSQ
ncbi:glycosyltransferase family 2 protein [bacterium]|nr:glycosyltransferase family 2 protein [bacterium]